MSYIGFGVVATGFSAPVVAPSPPINPISLAARVASNPTDTAVPKPGKVLARPDNASSPAPERSPASNRCPANNSPAPSPRNGIFFIKLLPKTFPPIFDIPFIPISLAPFFKIDFAAPLAPLNALPANLVTGLTNFFTPLFAFTYPLNNFIFHFLGRNFISFNGFIPIPPLRDS